MSLNLQNDGIAAVQALRGNPAFAEFRQVIERVFIKQMNAALEASPELRNDAIGYARALRDLYIATESAATDVHQTQIKKPGALTEKSSGR